MSIYTERSTFTSTSNNSLPRITAMPLVICSILQPLFPIANGVKDYKCFLLRGGKGDRALLRFVYFHELIRWSCCQLPVCCHSPLYYQALLAKLNQNTEADPPSELYSILKTIPRENSLRSLQICYFRDAIVKPRRCRPKSLSWLLIL